MPVPSLHPRPSFPLGEDYRTVPDPSMRQIVNYVAYSKRMLAVETRRLDGMHAAAESELFPLQ